MIPDWNIGGDSCLLSRVSFPIILLERGNACSVSRSVFASTGILSLSFIIHMERGKLLCSDDFDESLRL
jgi:hypothetical protein